MGLNFLLIPRPLYDLKSLCVKNSAPSIKGLFISNFEFGLRPNFLGLASNISVVHFVGFFVLQWRSNGSSIAHGEGKGMVPQCLTWINVPRACQTINTHKPTMALCPVCCRLCAAAMTSYNLHIRSGIYVSLTLLTLLT
jgi:hypothetical protein